MRRIVVISLIGALWATCGGIDRRSRPDAGDGGSTGPGLDVGESRIDGAGLEGGASVDVAGAVELGVDLAGVVDDGAVLDAGIDEASSSPPTTVRAARRRP